MNDIRKIVEFAKNRQIVPNNFAIFEETSMQSKVQYIDPPLTAMEELKDLVKILINDRAVSSRAALLSIFTLSSAQEAAMARRIDFHKDGHWFSRHYTNKASQKYRLWPLKMGPYLDLWASDTDFMFTSGRKHSPISGSALRMRVKLLGFSGINYRAIHALFSRWARAQEKVGSSPLPYICEGLIEPGMLNKKDANIMDLWYEVLTNTR